MEGKRVAGYYKLAFKPPEDTKIGLKEKGINSPPRPPRSYK